jgi:hypothetical protein
MTHPDPHKEAESHGLPEIAAKLWRNDIDLEKPPYRVLIKRGELVDEKRGGRSVPYKLYYPEINKEEEAVKAPLIIWSHGLGGTRDGAAFLARFVAGYGYILAHIQHDGTDDSLWRNEPDHPWDAIRRKTPVPWEVVKNRYLDASFALDELLRDLPKDQDLSHIIDTGHLGISGHSFGALTTQVMAGQAVGKGDEPEFFKDERFTAGILYSPVPNFRLDQPIEDIYGTITLPLLHMTGTKDESPVEGFGHEKRMDVWHHAGSRAEKYGAQHLMIKKGADHMVYNGSRGQLDNYPAIERDKDMIKVLSLAWWDAYLKQDKAAMDWLNEGGPQHWLGDLLDHRIKNN